MKKINYSIKPFRDVWVKDCYHMSILPVVMYVKGNGDIILYNQNFEYKKNKIGISYVCNDFENIYINLEKNGIKNIPLLNVQNIEEYIEEKLKKQYLVIVGIDNFYQKIRKDFYKKKHSGHSVLVNGVDIENRIFEIIEQPFFYSLNFDYYRLDYFSLKEAYFSFIDRKNQKNFFYNELKETTRIKNKEIPSLCSFDVSQRDINSNNTKSQKTFIKNVYLKEDKYNESLEIILQFKDEFNMLYLKCETENELSLEYIKELSDLINNKIFEKYLYDKMRLKNISSYLGYIIEKWKYVRMILSKHMFSGIYKSESVENCIMKLQDIYILEKNLIQERRKIFELL